MLPACFCSLPPQTSLDHVAFMTSLEERPEFLTCSKLCPLMCILHNYNLEHQQGTVILAESMRNCGVSHFSVGFQCSYIQKVTSLGLHIWETPGPATSPAASL